MIGREGRQFSVFAAFSISLHSTQIDGWMTLEHRSLAKLDSRLHDGLSLAAAKCLSAFVMVSWDIP